MISTDDICTYVINLKRCRRKKEKISKALDKNNLTYNFYQAVDASKFTPNIIENNKDIGTSYKNWLLKNKSKWGHLGCSMSHYNVLEKFINEHHQPYLLIFEDDVILDEDFGKKLLEVLNNHKNLEFDVLLAGYNCDSNYVPFKSSCSRNKDYTELNGIRSVNYFIGTHAYIIHRNNAQKILRDCKPYAWCLDHQLSGFIKSKNYKIYGIFEPIAFSQGNNAIPEWNYKKDHKWEFGSQTQAFNNKECFGDGGSKSVLYRIMQYLILFVIIVFFIILFKKLIKY